MTDHLTAEELAFILKAAEAGHRANWPVSLDAEKVFKLLAAAEENVRLREVLKRLRDVPRLRHLQHRIDQTLKGQP